MMFVFKEKEQKVIKFEDVKVGDRVKLANKNGDTAEITAVFPGSGSVGTDSNIFYERYDWSVSEILEKPMPNKPGTVMRGKVSGVHYVRMPSGWESLGWDRRKLSDISMKEAFQDNTVEVMYAPE